MPRSGLVSLCQHIAGVIGRTLDLQPSVAASGQARAGNPAAYVVANGFFGMMVVSHWSYASCGQRAVTRSSRVGRSRCVLLVKAIPEHGRAVTTLPDGTRAPLGRLDTCRAQATQGHTIG